MSRSRRRSVRWRASTVPLSDSGLALHARMLKSLNVMTLLSTGIFSSENVNDVPSMVTLTAVVSKLIYPSNVGLAMSPVICIEPLSWPDSEAILSGINGLTICNGNLIMRKSSRNGVASVESLSTPRAVMVGMESTMSVRSAISLPPAELATLTSRLKSPTRSRP